MTERLRQICAHIPACDVFADVGCDHGYCAEYVLKNALARRVYISDISANSLHKAEKLLKEYVLSGVCIPVVGDGFENIPEPCTALIAGMGGEEIVGILSRYLPKAFVLQPMKNSDKVRRFLVERGCEITCDFTFEDGKYYDLIVGKNTGGSCYSEREILYGRDNLAAPSKAFYRLIAGEIEKLNGYLTRGDVSQAEREKMQARLKEKEEILHEIKGNLQRD